jgi:hypothetical protein
MQTMIASLLHRGSDAPHLGFRDPTHDWLRFAKSDWAWVRSAKSPAQNFLDGLEVVARPAGAQALGVKAASLLILDLPLQTSAR